MFLRLLLAFVLIPLIELYLLLRIADHTGILATVGLVIATGVAGSYLAKREGARAWRRFREATAQGGLPSEEIQDGLMIVFAAALMLTPGLLTDATGFVLLIPAGRRWVRRFVMAPMLSGIQFRWVSMDDRGDVVQGSVVREKTASGAGSSESVPPVIEAEAVRRR